MPHRRALKRVIASAGAAAAVLAAHPSPADACGGFFCSVSPVDQNAERIVFRINRDRTVTAVVQIVYAGSPENFSWVVPVPSVADLDVFPQRALSALDVATQPIFQPPWQCFPLADAAGGPPGAPEDDGGVTVHDRRNVGPYATVTISSENPRALVTWLRDNDYRITPEMEPFVALYVKEGMYFLAMKLQPGRDTAEIQPIVMNYEGSEPTIPIRLTAVAAEPEMGIIAWVLGDGRFGPANFADVTIDDHDIVFSAWSFATNYLDVVAREVDEAGGHAFVTEYAGSTSPLLEQVRRSNVPDDPVAQEGARALIALLESAPYLTRLYTRVSPEEMDVDPRFRPVDTVDVSNVHDLSGNADQCEDVITQPPPCDMTYCGRAGLCAEPAEPQGDVFGETGCACLPGAVARVVADGRGGMRTTCQDSRMRFPDAAAGDVPTFGDPCLGVTCGGHGACVNMNGTPTCACDVGFVARAERSDAGVLPACVTPKTAVPESFYQRPLPALPNLPAFSGLRVNRVNPPGYVPPDTSGCAATGAGQTSPGVAGVLAAWAALGCVRRRRRHH